MPRLPVKTSALTARLAAVLLLLLAPPALSEDFRVSRLSTRLEAGTYMMNAAIEYRFNARVLEALENGVPITLEVHVQLRRKGAWIWERDLLDFRSRYQIRYHALASVYQVVDMQSGTTQNFATRISALNALGTISALPLVNEADLEQDESYILAVRTSLDIESLPLPLRPIAYVSPAWNLDSEWTTWRLQP